MEEEFPTADERGSNASEKNAAKRDAPTGDESIGDKPAGDEPAGDEPTGDRPTSDRPAGHYGRVDTAATDIDGDSSTETRSRRSSRRNAEIVVVVDLDTALALAENPIELRGYGALPVTALEHLQRAARGWLVTVTDRTGTPLATARYTPTTALDDWVLATRGTCTAPHCTVPVHLTQADHTVPYRHRDPAAGGRTDQNNLHPLCEGHHQLKTHGGYRTQRLSDGTILTRTPAGHVYRTPPPRLLPVAGTGSALVGHRLPDYPPSLPDDEEDLHHGGGDLPGREGDAGTISGHPARALMVDRSDDWHLIEEPDELGDPWPEMAPDPVEVPDAVRTAADAADRTRQPDRNTEHDPTAPPHRDIEHDWWHEHDPEPRTRRRPRPSRARRTRRGGEASVAEAAFTRLLCREDDPRLGAVGPRGRRDRSRETRGEHRPHGSDDGTRDGTRVGKHVSPPSVCRVGLEPPGQVIPPF